MHHRIDLQPFYDVLVLYGRPVIAFFKVGYSEYLYRHREIPSIAEDHARRSYQITARIKARFAARLHNFAWNNDANTVPHISVRLGHAHIVRGLLESGADFTVRDTDGNTPLHIAAFSGDDHVLATLAAAAVRL